MAEAVQDPPLLPAGLASNPLSTPSALGRPVPVPAAELNATHYDVIVVGAGVVGASLAYALGRSGRTVAVIERDWSEPDRIVGELLQPGGVRALACLDLLDTLEGIEAAPVLGYQVFSGERSVHIPYPNADTLKKGTKLSGRGLVGPDGRVQGRAFHHGRFIQQLRSKALAQPNVTCVEAIVRDLEEEQRSGHVVGANAVRKPGSGAKDTIGEDEELHLRAHITVIADGIFSKFRGAYGTTIKPEIKGHFVGLELDHAPMPNPFHGHVILGPSGPVLLYQIGQGDARPDGTYGTHTTRILIDVAGEQLPSASKGDLQRHIRHQVAPYLPGKLGETLLKELEATDRGEGSQRLRSMPNSFLPPSVQGQSRYRRGCILVGDAMNMRHPLTGGGMTVAFWDVVRLTNILNGGKWYPGLGLEREPVPPKLSLDHWDPQVRPALLGWHWDRKDVASTVNILAMALYGLFAASDANLEILREGCFQYFERGPWYVDGPVRLLSATSPSPALLFFHFFNVALYSIYALFFLPQKHVEHGKVVVRRASLCEFPGLVFRSLLVFWSACAVFLPVIWTEVKMNRPDFSHTPRKSGPGFIPKDATGPLTFLRFMVITCLVIIYAAWTFFDPTRHPNAFAARNVNNGTSALTV